MKTVCGITIALLLAVIAVGGYQFIYQGSTVSHEDGRTSIQLTPAERNLALSEMRTFLQTVQVITKGLTEDDMAIISEQARKVGMQTATSMPASLMGKLPLEFKQLGLATHQQFDELAMDAEQLGDKSHTLKQLSTLMQNCIACHAAYRFDAVEK